MEIHKKQWQYVYYVINSWIDKELKNLEIEYFNLGSEWICDNDRYYCHNYDYNDIKKELSSFTGYPVDNIVLHKITGYTTIPNYEKI